MHSVAPEIFEKLPEGHATHDPPPDVGLWYPGAHDEQDVAPISEVVPAGHGVHCEAPAAEYVPAGHAIH